MPHLPFNSVCGYNYSAESYAGRIQSCPEIKVKIRELGVVGMNVWWMKYLVAQEDLNILHIFNHKSPALFYWNSVIYLNDETESPRDWIICTLNKGS